MTLHNPTTVAAMSMTTQAALLQPLLLPQYVVGMRGTLLLVLAPLITTTLVVVGSGG